MLFNKAKERDIFCREKDLTAVITVINQYNDDYGFNTIDRCGEDDADIWVISFDSKEKRYKEICRVLNENGNVIGIVNSEGGIDLHFETK